MIDQFSRTLHRRGLLRAILATLIGGGAAVMTKEADATHIRCGDCGLCSIRQYSCRWGVNPQRSGGYWTRYDLYSCRSRLNGACAGLRCVIRFVRCDAV